MTIDEDLDARLVAADRSPGLNEHDAALVATFEAAEAASRSLSRRRGVIRAGIAGSLVIGLGFAAPAAAAAIEDFLAQTGDYCDWGTECGNGATVAESEWIDSTQSDFDDFAMSVFPDELPLPPGSSREELVTWLVESYEAQNSTESGGVLTTRLGLEGTFESRIYCGWVNEWLQADADRDDARQQRAAEVMREAAGWPATVKTDGGGIVDMLLQFAEGADDGDAGIVRAAASAWSCAAMADE